MSLMRATRRVLSGVACAVSAAGLAAATASSAGAAPVETFTAGAPTSADTIVRQPFAADSGDRCRYGQTRGALGWHLPTPGGGAVVVDVAGQVLDQPVVDVPTACGDDGRFSAATVTGFVGSRAVRTASVRADNGTQRFTFRIAVPDRSARLDRVEVRVCRFLQTAGSAVHCGAKQTYKISGA
jgi:hypothetical protein